MADHDELISRMVELTGTSAAQAQEYLSTANWNFEQACESYYASDGEASDDNEEPSTEPTAATYTGPRTLDGRPAPQYAGASSSAAKKPPKRTGLATLSSIGGGGHGHGHDDDDDDDDDDSEDERRGPRDLFAGGEKSGLAVQDPSQRGGSDPRRLINDILAKAKANAKQPAEEEGSSSAGPSRYFTRGGNVLGGDGVETRRVGQPEAAPAAAAAPSPETAHRELHIWEDGFSIDDGELHRFDDPDNQAALDMIRHGRAPLHLMNVRSDQRVDVKLKEHDEKYRQLPKIYRPFGGEGRRLGSPVPGVAAVAPPPPAAPSSQAAAGPAQISNTNVDASQPTLMLRIQLPDGTRLPARFNTSQTVGDVYEFVTRASPAISGRSWVLSTTFPNKDHNEKELVLGEMNEFKRGGTAVVKWA